MTLFGITGGVGMGKSTSAGILLKMDVAVIDTDQLARDIVVPGQPALEEIKAQFGARFLSEKGELLRKELAAEVFSDPAKRVKSANDGFKLLKSGAKRGSKQPQLSSRYFSKRTFSPRSLRQSAWLVRRKRKHNVCGSAVGATRNCAIALLRNGL